MKAKRGRDDVEDKFEARRGWFTKFKDNIKSAK
jgi:hypothetical protein